VRSDGFRCRDGNGNWRGRKLARSALKVAKQLLKSEAFLKNRAQSIKNKLKHKAQRIKHRVGIAFGDDFR
jgi:hypothetical protein